METNYGPKMRNLSPDSTNEDNNGDISRPKNNYYESFLNEQNRLIEIAKNYLKNNSENIIRAHHPELGGYEIKEVILPTPEEYLYNGTPLYDQFEKIVLSQKLDLPNKDALLSMGKYVRSSAFIDTAIEDNQRDEFVRKVYELSKDEKNVEEKEIYTILNNDKFQAQLIVSPIKLIGIQELFKNEGFLGKKFVVTQKIEDMSSKLMDMVSYSTNKYSVDRNKYSGYVKKDENGKIIETRGEMPIEDKKDVIKLTTELCREICIQYIETYKEKE